MRLNRKKRRGMFSFVETLSCLLIFALLLVGTLTLTAQSVNTQAEMQMAVYQKMDADFLAELFQTDIKSADMLDVVSDTELHIINEGSTIIYRIRDYELYRNDERVLEFVISGIFIPSDGTSVGLYLRLAGGEIIDVTICK